MHAAATRTDASLQTKQQGTVIRVRVNWDVAAPALLTLAATVLASAFIFGVCVPLRWHDGRLPAACKNENRDDERAYDIALFASIGSVLTLWLNACMTIYAYYEPPEEPIGRYVPEPFWNRERIIFTCVLVWLFFLLFGGSTFMTSTQCMWEHSAAYRFLFVFGIAWSIIIPTLLLGELAVHIFQQAVIFETIDAHADKKQ